MSQPANKPEATDTQPVSAAPQERRGLWRPLAVRDFRLLWFGEGISLLGDQFYLVALPWLTLQLTGSGLALGTVMMAAAIPRAALMLVGGAASDRLAPRALMIWSNAVRGIVVSTIALLVFFGSIHLWHLYVTAVVFGLADAFFYPAFTSMVPKLLDPDHLIAGNSLLQGTAQLNVLIGPAPAGLIIASAGIAAALGFDAVTFLFAIFMLVMIRGGRQPAHVEGAAAPTTKRAGLLSSISEGLRYAWADPVTRAIVLIIAAINLCVFGPFMVGLAALADKRFTQGAAGFGTMLSAWGGGALVGTLIGGSFGTPTRRGLRLVGVAAVLGIGLALIGVMPNVFAASIVIAVMALGSGFLNVGMMAWLQTRTEPRMLGRVMSLLMFAAVGLAPLSYVVSGALVDLNPTILFAAAGGIVLLVAMLSIANKTVRTID
ncbi:MAG: MFS transporter [Blastocatellia bacterium]